MIPRLLTALLVATSLLLAMPSQATSQPLVQPPIQPLLPGMTADMLAPSQADDPWYWPEPLEPTPPLFFRAYWIDYPNKAYIVWAQGSHARTFCLEKLAAKNTGRTEFLTCGASGIPGMVIGGDLPFPDYYENVNSTPAEGDTYILMERHNDGALLAVYTARLGGQYTRYLPLTRR